MTQLRVHSGISLEHLKILINRLNAASKFSGIVNEIVRAYKEYPDMDKARLLVLHNKTQSRVVFSDTLDTLQKLNWKSGDLIVAHDCSVMHIPFIVGSVVYVDEVCELCEFIVRKKGDVNAKASQIIPVYEKASKKIPVYEKASETIADAEQISPICEHEDKSPIFYAIEKKSASMISKLIELGANYEHGMVDLYSKSDRVSPVMYAISETVKSYEREDGSYEVIELLLSRVTVENVIDQMRENKALADVVLSFVSMVGLDLDVFPGMPMEAVKGDHVHIIELFLKCNRVFEAQLSAVKRSNKYKNMLYGRIAGRRGASAKAVPIAGFPLSTSFHRYVESLPDLSNSSFVGRNVIYSTDIGDYATQILALAAYYGHVEIVKWLLKNEVIDVNGANGYGYTPMHFAASMNHVDVVKLLFEAKASTDSRNMPYTTSAHIAAINGAKDVLMYLHATCPETLSKVDASGQNILHYAASCPDDRVEVVKFIIENVKELSPDDRADSKMGEEVLMNRTCSEHQIRCGCAVTAEEKEQIVEHIKSRGAEIDGSSPLYIAVESQNVKIAQYLIEHANCDPEKTGPGGECTALNLCTNGGTLLHMAVRTKNLDFVRKLLTYKSLDFDIKFRGKTAMDLAIVNRDRAMINLLLQDPRQGLTTAIGYRRVPYSKILSFRGLLDYQGKKILVQRVKGNRSKHGSIITASTLFICSAIIAVSMALGSNVIFKLCGIDYAISWEKRVLLVVLLLVPMVAAYVIFSSVSLIKEKELRSKERFHLSTAAPKPASTRRYDSYSSTSDSVLSGASGSGGFKDLDGAEEYLADDSDPAPCVVRRKRSHRYYGSGQRGSIGGVEQPAASRDLSQYQFSSNDMPLPSSELQNCQGFPCRSVASSVSVCS